MRTWAKAELTRNGLSHFMKGRILRCGDCVRVAQGKKAMPQGGDHRVDVLKQEDDEFGFEPEECEVSKGQTRRYI